MKHKTFRKKYLLAPLIAGLLLMMWSVSWAQTTVDIALAQKQVKNIVPTLNDSEAERVSGAYVPGMGATIVIDLLRGPNSAKNKAAQQGTRDWAIYLMQTFGARLTAVPPEESIGFSVNFYDYNVVAFRQLVVVSKAADVATPAKYKIYLDGKPFDGTAAQPAAAAKTTTPAAAGTATKAPSGTAVAGTATTKAASGTPVATAAATPSANFTPGSVKATVDFADPQAAAKDWLPIAGQWEIKDQGYNQNELGKFDLYNFYNRPIAGDFTLQASVKYVQGDMGAGLIFNSPGKDKKSGAQMVSYTGKGTFFQWGYFDASGIFQYQGGKGIAVSGADGKAHVISVKITGNTYDVSLDGAVMGSKMALFSPVGGYAGLLASTSQVVFDNVKIESVN